MFNQNTNILSAAKLIDELNIDHQNQIELAKSDLKLENKLLLKWNQDLQKSIKDIVTTLEQLEFTVDNRCSILNSYFENNKIKFSSFKCSQLNQGVESESQLMDPSDSSDLLKENTNIALENLVHSLKIEINTKDKVLQIKKTAIDKLETELSEIRRKLVAIEDENKTLNRTVHQLNEVLREIKDEKQKYEIFVSEKNKLIDDIQLELNGSHIQCEKLKDECKNQQQTISYLRQVLEETKRNGNVTVSSTSSTPTSLFSSIWRSVHDV